MMYISVNEAAQKFKISTRRVQTLCEQGRIKGANMVSGVWLIPKDASKPVDKRKKVEKKTLPKDILDMNDVCESLSISQATLKNWIKLKKISPDVKGKYFSKKYITNFILNNKLKSRRNKKNTTGKELYKDYIKTETNKKLVEEILNSQLIKNQKDLVIILANFAVQLFYQSKQISFSNNKVLFKFLNNKKFENFKILIKDLLGNYKINTNEKKLDYILSKRIDYVHGEDTLGFIYISLKDIGKRKSSGTYYTPENVVNKLLDNLAEYWKEDLKDKTICDPCCGTGNFLLKLGNRKIDYTNIYGQDIDILSVYLARINLSLVAPDIDAKDIKNRIIIGNAYFKTFNQKFDIIIGNPPWGSDIKETDKLKCRKIFKSANTANIESYDLFVEKALSMLNFNGFLAFVLPEAILNVASHDPIRQILLDTCSFKFVSYLGNVFSNVQCPAIILGVLLDDKKTTVGCKVTIKDKHFTIKQKRKFPNKILSFNVSDEENTLLNKISNIDNVRYLKGNAKFALGIVTGKNSQEIIKQKKAGYEVVLKGKNIYRYGIERPDNYICFKPETFQQVAPTEMYRAKEKLLYRFICEVPVFAYDDQKSLSLNSCNIVIPEIPDLKMKYVLAILNSSVVAYFVLKKFGSVKLLRSHIEQIPIPFVDSKIQNDIIKKVDNIMQSSHPDNLYRNLDEDIMQLYNISQKQIEIIRKTLQEKNLFFRS